MAASYPEIQVLAVGSDDFVLDDMIREAERSVERWRKAYLAEGHNPVRIIRKYVYHERQDIGTLHWSAVELDLTLVSGGRQIE